MLKHSTRWRSATPRLPAASSGIEAMGVVIVGNRHGRALIGIVTIVVVAVAIAVAVVVVVVAVVVGAVVVVAMLTWSSQKL